jgi:hypothetical protein
MKSKATRVTINKLQDIIDRQTTKVSPLLHSLIALELGLYQEVPTGDGDRTVWKQIDGSLSEVEAVIYWETPYKAEFAKAFQKKHKRLRVELHELGEPKPWNEEAYRILCRKLGVKP